MGFIDDLYALRELRRPAATEESASVDAPKNPTRLGGIFSFLKNPWKSLEQRRLDRRAAKQLKKKTQAAQIRKIYSGMNRPPPPPSPPSLAWRKAEAEARIPDRFDPSTTFTMNLRGAVCREFKRCTGKTYRGSQIWPNDDSTAQVYEAIGSFYREFSYSNLSYTTAERKDKDWFTIRSILSEKDNLNKTPRIQITKMGYTHEVVYLGLNKSIIIKFDSYAHIQEGDYWGDRDLVDTIRITISPNGGPTRCFEFYDPETYSEDHIEQMDYVFLKAMISLLLEASKIEEKYYEITHSQSLFVGGGRKTWT